MPTRTKDYPIYTYDEPAVYKDFSGGINTDPSNDHLLDTELRDCVNMTYFSGALVKRQGAKKICDVVCEDSLFNIQGVFLFTYKITYLIVAADGKLYQGIYNEDTTIRLNRLYIKYTKPTEDKVFDELNVFSGVEEIDSNDYIKSTNHEGYVQTFFRNIQTDETFTKNLRGDFDDITGGAVNVGDVFISNNTFRYLCIKNFVKEFWYPSVSQKWELLAYTGSEAEPGSIFKYVEDGVTYTIQADDPSVEAKINAITSSNNVHIFDIDDNRVWYANDFCYYDGKFYKCKVTHQNMHNALMNNEYFIDLTNLSGTNFVEESFFVFQNYRKIEAATLNNKLYIATGTRIIEVSMFANNLVARPITPYLCNYTEITKIGYNYMSPYPELAVASQLNTVTTSITGIKVTKKIAGNFLLTPIMNIQIGDSVDNYYYRWEKNINGTWYTVVPFAAQRQAFLPSGDGTSIPVERKNYYYIEVDDADKYTYRCTFARAFETTTDVVEPWNMASNYKIGDVVSIDQRIFKCINSHNAEDIVYQNNVFDLYGYKAITSNGETNYERIQLWEEVYNLELLLYIHKTINQSGEVVNTFTTVYDYKIDKVTGEYYGSATSVLFDNELGINDNFLMIQSCTKVIADGNKLLFYADRFNSGMWFKTIINNPGYVTDRGNLSFKTNKNEAVIKVIPFQGNILVFANSDEIGGSIHLVQGNGDDYDDQSGYYSPYQRRTINASITSSNADSIQICDNIIVFKYFNRVYYINASDLNNDTVKVNPCNDRVLNNEGDVKIPWDDDDCISEVTKDYYALLWKEKYALDSSGDLIQTHPGMRVKMYYKMSVQYDDNTYGMPWLRDEGKIFDTNFILYIKGKPIYLYNNVLLSLDKNYYLDINDPIVCNIHFKAVDLNYESFLKLIENCIVTFHRNQFNKIDIDVIIKNEGGHILLDTESKRYAANDLGTLYVGTKYKANGQNKIGTTIQDNKMFITINKFPCLTADTSIKVITDGSFTLTGLTYSYTTIDSPDSNPSEIYNKIVRG